jgi:uncharacterized protein (TIGR00369 family)
MSGLELMRWIQAQQPTDVPSIGRLLGMRFDRVEKGHVVGSLDIRPDFANPLGTVHGGIAATLLDSVMGCAVHTTLAAGVSYTTLELKVKLHPSRPDQRSNAHRGGQCHPRRPQHGHCRGQGRRRAGEAARPRHHDLHDSPASQLMPDAG